jgi:hypothetical protein
MTIEPGCEAGIFYYLQMLRFFYLKIKKADDIVKAHGGPDNYRDESGNERSPPG